MDQRLSEYISQAKAGGMAGSQIKNELVKAGWPALEVEEALAKSSSIHPDRIKSKSSIFLKKFFIVFFVLSMLGGAAYGFWYLDQKIERERPNVSFEDQTATDSQESSASSSQQGSLFEDSVSSIPTSTKLVAIPAEYQLKEAHFSFDGKKVLWVAEKGGQKFILLNELRSEGYDAVSNCQFNNSGSHFSCVATKDKKKIVIFDTNPGKQYDSLIKEPFFSAGGEGLIYAATLGTNKFLVLDGEESPIPFDSIGGLVISPDLSRIAYIGTRGKDKFLVINGEEKKIEGIPYSDPVFIGSNKIGYGVRLNNDLLWKEVEAR
jgi:hypothetical protein